MRASRSAKATEDDVEGHGLRRTSPEPDDFSKAKATGGEGFARAKASDEDDVEGHLSRQRVEGEGFARAKVDGEGFSKRQETEDDDVEGHAFNLRSPSSRGE